ncbi:hypothetical protein MY11210_004076 [Beauveria gryllotalpidicola]
MKAQTLATATFAALSAFSSVAATSDQSRAALMSPREFKEQGWQHQGCYVDVGRTISDSVTTDGGMTNEKCTAYCFERGFVYAGTEYYSECYCGNFLSRGAKLAKDEDCSTQCAGNKTEACGGRNRLTLYKTDLITPPAVNPGVGDWESMGCYIEGSTGRALERQIFSVPSSNMTASQSPLPTATSGSGDTTLTQCPNQPATVGQEWNFHGCYTEGDGVRALDNRSYSDNEMTLGDCSRFCSGFAFFGLEYGRECYCGNTFNGGAVETSESECSMLCPGGMQCDYCGAGNRLSVYLNSRIHADPSGSAVTAASSTYTTTSTSLRISGGPSSVSSSAISTLSPTASSIAGLKPTIDTETPSSVASSIVSTATAKNRTAVDSHLTIPTSGSISKLSTTESDYILGLLKLAQYPYKTPSASYQYFDICFFSAIHGIDFDQYDIYRYFNICFFSTINGIDFSQNDIYRYFNIYFFSTINGIDSSSNDICRYFDICFFSAINGFDFNQHDIYRYLDICFFSAIDDINFYQQSLDTHHSFRFFPPTPTGLLPDGWGLYGCWIDGAQGRILDKQLPDSDELTLQSCAASCAKAGYSIAGAEFYSQCFCDNHIINGGSKANSTDECNTPCAGNSTQNCGGSDRMTIMSVGQPKIQLAAVTLQAVGNWKYQGCYEDNVNQSKVFFWQNLFPDVMTPEMCLNRCADFGYMAAGLEYGQECYCGDPQNIIVKQSKKKNENECDVPCVGNASAFCGGGSRLSTYFWDGKPFYSWDFPEAGSPAAGSYDFLIGGTNIPLITSQAINGKVTFLEKFGTGPPNSTGAYELDLSQIDNWDLAWRTMHVKTDVFCAAGLTLPDKAGRQINIGGWSGVSTFGVRLYSPDGKAGVHGKNDWEENASILKLQDGRWYPTAMNMANGSILIIGGEEGSNAAPVPTLEILPYTGTKPLYMDWLERTDPNNLYPFATVLPSGGIFVAYWNEARILDENTFATVKTLPMIPGAVNDPMGGRTYPLEGAAVLLPQYAPYKDPLGVLICGGSTTGPNNALDNCVSIYPDAESPKWELERMPSTRVMSCMAPLPDGTFLILNGAHHGVAGFGLGVDPNLNALMYDPRKPLGRRITVMANTTVARMYHSEGITLLDGRVLVSGSDPQDGVNPQEYRIETFTPPYLLSGKPRPTFALKNTDWKYGQKVSFKLGSKAVNGDITVSLLGSVSSTHGNSMGARTLFPDMSCSGTSCTVTAPPGKYIAPPGWYQFFVLDGGIPAVGVFIRIGGDPAGLGNWPEGDSFVRPGV